MAGILTRAVVALLALQLLGGLATSPSRTFLPVYMTALGHPALAVGAVITAQQVAGLIASWVGGALSDALGRKRTFLIGQLGAIASAASFFVGGPAAIGALRAVGGFCHGMQTVAAQGFLVDMAPAANLGLVSAFFNWGYTLGGAGSSPLAGLALERYGYRAMALGLIATALVGMALAVRRLPQARVATVTGSARGGLNYGPIIRTPGMISVTLLRFFPTFFWGMAGVIIPLLLLRTGATAMTIAWYATVSQLLAAAAQAATGRAADRLSLHGTTLVVVSLLLFSIVGLAVASSHLVALVGFGTLSTMAAWSLSVLVPSLVAEVAPTDGRGRALGWVHLWWNLGMILGALLGGALMERSAALPLWLAAGVNVVTLAVALRLVRPGETRQSTSTSGSAV